MFFGTEERRGVYCVFGGVDKNEGVSCDVSFFAVGF